MPLGVWISQGEKETGPRAMLVTWGLVAGSLGSVVMHNPWFAPFGVAMTAGISTIPILTRLRRVLKQGFTVDDLHDALRERELVRTEELRYERQFSSVPLSPALRVILLVSSSSWVAQSWIATHASASELSPRFLSVAMVLLHLFSFDPGWLLKPASRTPAWPRRLFFVGALAAAPDRLRRLDHGDRFAHAGQSATRRPFHGHRRCQRPSLSRRNTALGLPCGKPYTTSELKSRLLRSVSISHPL